MKKWIIATMLLLLMFGCSNAQDPSPVTQIKVDLETGTFNVTPQEFIDQWNDTVKEFQKTSKDEKTKLLIHLPNYIESGKEMKMTDGFDVVYTASDTGKMVSFKLNSMQMPLQMKAQ